MIESIAVNLFNVTYVNNNTIYGKCIYQNEFTEKAI